MEKGQKSFRNPYDSVLLSYSVLKRLGCGEVSTFEERLRSQKVQYFAQLFSVSIWYPYNLYLRGPYSPDLAHDLFQIKEKKLSVDSEKFIPNELEERFSNLKKFIQKKSTRQLELISTLHWLTKIGKFSLSDAKKKIAEWKNATTTEISESTESLSVLLKEYGIA